MAQALRENTPGVPEAEVEVERRKPLCALLLIAVGIDKPDRLKIIEIENVCAGAATPVLRGGGSTGGAYRMRSDHL